MRTHSNTPCTLYIQGTVPDRSHVLAYLIHPQRSAVDSIINTSTSPNEEGEAEREMRWLTQGGFRLIHTGLGSCGPDLAKGFLYVPGFSVCAFLSSV